MDPYTENLLLTDVRWETEREYWINKLGRVIEPSGFTPDRMRSDVASGTDHDTVQHMFSLQLSDRIRQVCNDREVAVYALLVSAVSYVLNRYNGEEVITVGMPLMQSADEDKPAAVKRSHRLTVLQLNVDEQITFRQYLLDVSRVVQEALKYKHFPYEMIIRMLHGDAAGPVPTLRVVVSLSLSDQKPDDYLVPPSVNGSEQAVETWFAFRLVDGQLQLHLQYRNSMFSSSLMETVCRHVDGYLQEVLDGPNMKLCQIRMLYEDEVKQETDLFNRTETAYPKDRTIHELADEQALKTPTKTALRFREREYSYEFLKQRSDRLAAGLRELGMQRGEAAAVMSERSPEMIVAILAVLKAGGTYLPIDPDYPSERIQHMLHDSGAKWMLTHSGLTDRIGFQGQIIDLHEPDSYAHSCGTQLSNVNDPEDAAYIIYTSGSTGKPKGVVVPHRAVVNFIQGMVDQIAFDPDKTIAAITTVSFDIFVLETLLPLTRGLTVAIASEDVQNHPERLKKWLSSQQVHMLQTTPSRMQMLLSSMHGHERLPLTDIMVGGEALADEALRKLQGQFPDARLYNMYGPTETTVWSAVKEVTNARQATLGTPIANTRIYILDRLQRPMPIGVAGEICIAGDGVTSGYWCREELNKEKFVADPFHPGIMYRTGDLARRLPDGDIDFLGRIDHQVKIRGYRVELGEVESALMAVEGVKAAVCTATTDNENNGMLAAYYVAERRIEADEWRDQIASVLPNYMLPSFYIPLKELPYTPNGKIDRKQLPAPYEADDGGLTGTPPADDMERAVLAVWQRVLGVSGFGVTDDFFMAGGHSLTALKLEVEMEKAGIPLAAEEVYRHATVREFVRHRGARRRSEAVGIAAHSQADESAASNAEAGLASVRPDGADESFERSGMTLVADEAGIVPFNDLFYRECFYNSLFPVIRYFGASPLPVLMNDVITYRYDASARHFKVVYDSIVPLSDLLSRLNIRMTVNQADQGVVERLIHAVDESRPAIARIDCYHASNRSDTYRKLHWPHAWLVFGYDSSRREFAVLEHDRIENLTYRKRRVRFEDALQGHIGYGEQFAGDGRADAYYEFSRLDDSPVNTAAADRASLQEEDSRLQDYGTYAEEGLKTLPAFMDAVCETIAEPERMKTDGDDLIDAFNQIVHAKLAERYRCELDAAVSENMREQAAQCLRTWQKIRALVVKAVYAGWASAATDSNLREQFGQACKLEQSFIHVRYGR